MGSYNCTCYPEYTGNGTSCTGRFLDNTISFYHVLLLSRNATGVSNALLNSNVCKSFIRCLGRPSVILKWPKFKTPIALKCFSSASVVFFFSDFDECANNTDNCDVNAYCNNTVGSFNCTCNSGYTGNGTTCAGKYDYFVLDEVLVFIFHTLLKVMDLLVPFLSK